VASGGGAVAAALATAAMLTLCSRMEAAWVPLLFVTLVPWLAAVDAARTTRQAVASALVLTLAFVAGVFWWFGLAVATYANASPAVGAGALVLLTPLLAPQYVVAAAVRSRVRRSRRPTLAPLASGAAWIGSEWLLPKLFGDSLGHGLYASRVLRQAADVAGVPGLTAIVLVVNECALACVRAARPGRRLGACALAATVLLATAGYGRTRLRGLETTDAPVVRVTAVQGDIGQYDRLRAERGTYAAVREIVDTYVDLTRRALAKEPTDLVVWPETVYPTTFGSPKSPDGAAFDRELEAFAAEMGAPFVFGTYDREGDREYNAAALLERGPDGNVTWDAYRKAALFPLIEYVPPWLDRPIVRRTFPWLGSWTPGGGASVFTLRLPDGRPLRIAPLVCYDATHPPLAAAAARDGADLLVTLSNDSWFDVGRGPLLHLVVSAFRSVETRRPQVRATNTGISVVIDATGDLIARADVHERRAVTAAVRLAHADTTPALGWGRMLGPAGLVLGLALLVLAGRPRPSH